MSFSITLMCLNLIIRRSLHIKLLTHFQIFVEQVELVVARESVVQLPPRVDLLAAVVVDLTPLAAAVEPDLDLPALKKIIRFFIVNVFNSYNWL